jgi:hypothetical protein
VGVRIVLVAVMTVLGYRLMRGELLKPNLVIMMQT